MNSKIKAASVLVAVVIVAGLGWAFLPRNSIQHTLPKVSSRETSSTHGKYFEIQGHRGARAVRAENSLSAFRYALEIGVDTLEMDLHATKDNVLVVTHDPFLNASVCVNAKGQSISSNIKIRNLTLAQLKTYDCGVKINPRFPKQVVQAKEKIPALQEVLIWLRESTDPRSKTVLLNIETKTDPGHPDYNLDPSIFALLLSETIDQYGLQNRVTVQSFDFRTLFEIRKLMPQVNISALVEDRPKVGSLLATAQKLNANIVSPNYEWLTQSDVAELQGAGIRVIPWTVNDAPSWKKMVALGVDGIISDDPKPLIDFRAELAK